MSVSVAQLSCQQCQRRKTKCNKTLPCSACVKAGIACTAVQRHRLPRGRSGNLRPGGAGEQALKNRIARLEAVVSQIQQKGSSTQATSDGIEQNPLGSSSFTSTSVESFVAPAFWTELSDAVAGLRDVLEHPDTAEEADEVTDDLVPSSKNTSVSDSSDSAISPESFTFLFGSNLAASRSRPNPPRELKNRLLTVYKDRVDAIFKPLHWPSALSTIRPETWSSQDVKPSTDAAALESAIYFTAACSLFDHELDQRQLLVQHFRRATEEAFVEAGLLTTTSFTVLQSFVIYLAGLRACQANAQQWTLTATAIRIASAQGIPARLSALRPSLDTEVQRRLWFCIGVLDLQSAFDRGSQPLLKSSDFQSWPLNINDSEMSVESILSPDRTQDMRYTEMSISLIIHRAGICQRRLTEIGSASSANRSVDLVAVYNEQVEVLADFERHATQLQRVCDILPSPIQMFAMAIARESLIAMRMLLHRPLYRRIHGYIPLEYESAPKFDLLGTAVEVLESSEMKRSQPEFAKWAWFSWVKWYALAVVLAELCTAHGPQADRAWEIAQRSYHDYAKIVADTKTGLLWKPIVKLMRKVKGIRESQANAQHQVSLAPSYSPYPSQFPDAGAMEALSLSSQAQSSSSSTDCSFINQPSGSVSCDYSHPSHGIPGVEDMSWLHWDLMIGDFIDFDVYNN